MRRREFPMILAVMAAVATSAVPVAPASARTMRAMPEAAQASSSTVRLEIETSGMGKEAESTRAWVLRDGTAALAGADIEVSEAATTTVRVVIEPKGLGYSVSIEVREDGQPQPLAARGPKVCESCTRTELVGLIDRELAWVGGWLSTDVGEDAAESDGAGLADGADDSEGDGEPGADKLEEQPADTDEPRERRRLHALGWAGVGVGAIGLGTLVAGGVVAGRSYEARAGTEGYQIPRVARPKVAGWTMVGVGAAAVVGGTVMVVLDLVRQRPRSVAVSPWLDRRSAGLWIGRRF